MSVSGLDIIKVNVSGRSFDVDRKILTLSPLFADVLSDCDVKSEEIKIYRSPMLFEHVYAYMLDESYVYPLNVDGEIKYYGLEPSKLPRPYPIPGPKGDRGDPGERGRHGERGPPCPCSRNQGSSYGITSSARPWESRGSSCGMNGGGGGGCGRSYSRSCSCDD